MSYQSWSVVFGEQPSAAKWNILGTNDASFNDGSGIGDDKIVARHIDWATTGANGGIWGEELGRTTLGTAGTALNVSFSARKYLRVMIHTIPAGSGTLRHNMRFNSDSGTNYSYGYIASITGSLLTGNDVSQSQFAMDGTNLNVSDVYQATIDIYNQQTTTKRVAISTHLSGAAAATSDVINNLWGHWANTSNQITSIQIGVATGTATFATGSEIVVQGHN